MGRRKKVRVLDVPSDRPVVPPSRIEQLFNELCHELDVRHDQFIEARNAAKGMKDRLEIFLLPVGTERRPRTRDEEVVEQLNAGSKVVYAKEKPARAGAKGGGSASPAPKPEKMPRGEPKPCCGSKASRHKAGCTGSVPAVRSPAGSEEAKTWKCVSCGNKTHPVTEKPEECDECPGTVFVEVNDWEA